MTKKKSNSKTSSTPTSNKLAQLPCRAQPHEAAFIRKAADLDARGNQTSFIVGAAVTAAKKSIAAHGLTEADVLAEFGIGTQKRA